LVVAFSEQLITQDTPDRAEALMLCFGRLRPGILDFVKREALRQAEVDKAERRRRYLAPNHPQGNRLVEFYNRTRGRCWRKIDESQASRHGHE
jgi:hypothetical protein